MLIELLIPAYGITLFHGQPRAGKSLALLECLLAVATGTPAFSVEGLAVPRAAPVLYITEEDPEVEVWKRLDAMCRGRGLTGPPESFFLSVGKRLWIDDPKWQARIIESVRRNRIQVVAVDPLRSVTAHADQGPAELNPVQRFLRRLMGETGCSVWLCHHDTKPPARGLDSRPLPQRASGGGVFSLSDSPIHVRVAGERPFRSVLTPKSYKFLTTPDPVAFMLTTTDDGGWLLAGTRDQVESAEDIEHDEEDLILRFLADHPESSRNAVREGIQKNKEKTLERLRRLEADHRIESVGAGRRTTLRLIEPGDHPVNGSDGSRTVPEPQPPVGSTVPLPIGREPRTVLGPNGRIVWLNRPSPSLRRTP